MDETSRFCWRTISRPPASRSTTNRVAAPAYTTSATVPVALWSSSPTGASTSSTRRSFSGRTLNVPSLPSTALAASPEIRLEVPTNPATNGVEGRS